MSAAHFSFNFLPSRVFRLFALSKHLRDRLQDLAFLIKPAFGPLTVQNDRGLNATLSDYNKYLTDAIHFFFGLTDGAYTEKNAKMKYANEHNDAVVELPEAILWPTRTDAAATSAEKNAETPTNPETTTAANNGKGKKNLPSAAYRYYSRSDVCNQEFRRKCLAGIDKPALGPSPADLCCALLGVKGCNEKNLPKNHVWWKFAGAHPEFADYCRLAVERYQSTRGQQFVICLSDGSLRPKHSPPRFTFCHPDYDGGHPPDEMLPHMNSNQPTAELPVTRRGRGRPPGTRNRPKGERAGTDGVKKTTPRKHNNVSLKKILDETSTTGSAENKVGNAERQLHTADSSGPEQASSENIPCLFPFRFFRRFNSMANYIAHQIL